MIYVEAISWRSGEPGQRGEVEISYSSPADLREIAGQLVLRTSQLVIPMGHPSYPDLQELYDQAQDIVRDVLEDFEESPAWTPPEDEDDEEDDDDG